MNEKEPLDTLLFLTYRIMLTPYALTKSNDDRDVRIIGKLLCFLWAYTWIITGIPYLLLVIILGTAQIIKDT